MLNILAYSQSIHEDYVFKDTQLEGFDQFKNPVDEQPPVQPVNQDA